MWWELRRIMQELSRDPNVVRGTSTQWKQQAQVPWGGSMPSVVENIKEQCKWPGDKDSDRLWCDSTELRIKEQERAGRSAAGSVSLLLLSTPSQPVASADPPSATRLEARSPEGRVPALGGSAAPLLGGSGSGSPDSSGVLASGAGGSGAPGWLRRAAAWRRCACRCWPRWSWSGWCASSWRCVWTWGRCWVRPGSPPTTSTTCPCGSPAGSPPAWKAGTASPRSAAIGRLLLWLYSWAVLPSFSLHSWWVWFLSAWDLEGASTDLSLSCFLQQLFYRFAVWSFTQSSSLKLWAWKFTMSSTGVMAWLGVQLYFHLGVPSFTAWTLRTMKTTTKTKSQI